MKTVMSPKPYLGEHDGVGNGRSPEIDTDITNQGEVPTVDEENSYINLGYSPLPQGEQVVCLSFFALYFRKLLYGILISEYANILMLLLLMYLNLITWHAGWPNGLRSCMQS